MVESSVLDFPDFLEIYGDGADINGASSRILFPDKLATKRIICCPPSGAIMQDLLTGDKIVHGNSHLVFDRFVRMTKSGWYEEAPDFDYILCTQGSREIVMPIETTQFELISIGS
ncbi:hypothetical protein GCM10009069_02780 [Algimonas arctica]|uniref:Uncharacterized protein n=1 Tax=Algimonas arctica TaxID=1479486 RepID=A0A8J3G110_9PROT|nr:hypothetical protein GCM10009069_02780 [Algimonas arctica]